jgi:multiple sugar transport system permease protein
LRSSVAIWALNGVFAVAFLMPLSWALSVSLLPRELLFTYPPTLFHWPPSLQSYVEVWSQTGGRFLDYAKVSATIAAATAGCVSVVSSLAGYAFARLRFVGRSVLFLLLLATMMFPFTAVLIPLYSMMSGMGLVNKPVTLVLLYTVFQIPFCTFIFRNAFEAIPASLADAALIDGCSSFGVFYRVMVPLARPAIATVVIYSVYHSWNEFTTAFIFLASERATTVPVALATLARTGRFATRWDVLMAASILSFIPVMVIFLAFQRYFVKGLTAGSGR